MRRGPEGAGRDVPEVAERPPVVRGRVLAPAGDGEVLPSAVPAARVGDHDVIPAVRQELHLRRGRVGPAERAHRDLGARRRRAGVRRGRGRRVERARARDPLLEQQRGRLERRVGREALLHPAVEEHLRQRQERHPLVVRHVGANDGVRVTARQARRRVVNRLVEAELPLEALCREPLQVRARLLGRHHQREGRRVGRDDEIVREAALEAEARARRTRGTGR